MAKKKEKTFKGHTVEFEVDDAGNVTAGLKGQNKMPAKQCEVDVTPLDPALFENVIIAISYNPTCYWYYTGGKWYWICV